MTSQDENYLYSLSLLIPSTYGQVASELLTNSCCRAESSRYLEFQSRLQSYARLQESFEDYINEIKARRDIDNIRNYCKNMVLYCKSQSESIMNEYEDAIGPLDKRIKDHLNKKISHLDTLLPEGS